MTNQEYQKIKKYEKAIINVVKHFDERVRDFLQLLIFSFYNKPNIAVGALEFNGEDEEETWSIPLYEKHNGIRGEMVALVSFCIMRSIDNGDDYKGIGFKLVNDDASIHFIPYNFTKDLWIDPTNLEALEERFTLFINNLGPLRKGLQEYMDKLITQFSE